MSKKSIRLILLLILLCAAVAIFFLVGGGKEEEKNESSVEKEVTQIAVPDEGVSVTGISYKNDKGEYSFALADGVWVYEDDKEFPLSAKYTDNLERAVTNINVTRDITDEGGNEADYGFDASAVTLSLDYSNGDKKDFIIGNSCTGGNYLKHDGRIYVVLSGLASACSYDIYDMVDTGSLIILNSDKVLSVTVDGNEYTDTEKVKAVCYEHQFININSVVDYKNAEKYGFDGTEHTVTYKYTTVTYTEDTNQAIDKEVEYTFRFAEKNGNEYLMLPGDSFIYLSNGASDLLTAENAQAEIEPLPEATE